MMAARRRRLFVLALLGAGLGTPLGSAWAAKPISCEQAIAHASEVYYTAQLEVLRKCEKAQVQGRVSEDVDCMFDDPMSTQLDDLATALAKEVGKECGGTDETCGTDDDPSLAASGWGDVTQCPDLENLGCTNTIQTCSDVTDCVQCVATAAAEQVIGLNFEDFDSTQFGTRSTINLCQAAIGKAATKYAEVSANALERCWQARIAGKRSDICPGAASTKTSRALVKAEAKKRQVICKACGGADRKCGTSDDLLPDDIGFGTLCPDVTVPSTGEQCGASIFTLADIVACVDCVGRYKAECMTRLGAIGVVPYPPECSGVMSGTTTTIMVPTSSSTTAPHVTTTVTTTTLAGSTCGNGKLDPGEQCDASSPSGGFTCSPGETCDATCHCVGGSTTSTTGAEATTTSSTGAVTTTTQPSATASFLDFTIGSSTDDCGTVFDDAAATDDVDTLSCGGLDIGGGASTVFEATTPDGSTNRFTLSCNGNSCTIGPTTTAGAGFDCTNTGCSFGLPLPIPNGSLSTCVANTFSAPASGTVDISTGVTSASISLASNVLLTSNDAQPCPICRSGSVSGPACAGSPASPCKGVCQGSPNQGLACTSTNSDGLSRDCSPPASVQGTSKCFGGTNNGQTCTTSAQCSGGACALFVGTLPVNISPLTTGTAQMSSASGNFCPNQADAGCFGDPDCEAFNEIGTPAGSLLPVGSSHDTTLVSTFCIPASGNVMVDSASSLPGPGATSLPGTFTLHP